MGWLYNRAFEDTDGHFFEAAWVDMSPASAAAGVQAGRNRGHFPRLPRMSRRYAKAGVSPVGSGTACE